MALSREIKSKITSIKKIEKITKAMQSVAASKMYRAKQRMMVSMPYALKLHKVVQHIATNNRGEEHACLEERKQPSKVGYIVISTDRGLCGGLNLNLFEAVLTHARVFQQQQIGTAWCLFGKKEGKFFSRIGMEVVAQVDGLGDSPAAERVMGAIKIMLDSYKAAGLDRLFLAHNEFINTLSQRPVVQQLLPLARVESNNRGIRDYLFEPLGQDREILDAVITRHIETQAYQSLVANLACEQVARMMAMQQAAENAKEYIKELQMIYNKVRQELITSELSEILGGVDTSF